MLSEIKKILMEKPELTVEHIERNKNIIFDIIPELRDEDGFNQRNPWHIYDVWRHTEVALSNSNYDFEERFALLLHDIGKPNCCQEDGDIRHFRGHAKKSAEISKDILKRLSYGEEESKRILFLIENHSSIIDISTVNESNIELIKKLLDIQYADTKAYNPEKIDTAIAKLDEVKKQLEELSNSYEDKEDSR